MITIKLNGRAPADDVDGDPSLSFALRDTFEMNGTKYACPIARCGARTVFSALVGGVRMAGGCCFARSANPLMRRLGATARDMLIRAAAARFEVVVNVGAALTGVRVRSLPLTNTQLTSV